MLWELDPLLLCGVREGRVLHSWTCFRKLLLLLGCKHQTIVCSHLILALLSPHITFVVTVKVKLWRPIWL
jgi:hypothetical protein